jgi:hypothetical protein
MIRGLSNLLLTIACLAALAGTPAAAQGGGCFSDVQTRNAIASGQAQPLSNFIGQIQARFGGQVAGGARLCPVGGRLFYFVTMLVGGQVREVRVDAQSGAAQ